MWMRAVTNPPHSSRDGFQISTTRKTKRVKLRWKIHTHRKLELLFNLENWKRSIRLGLISHLFPFAARGDVGKVKLNRRFEFLAENPFNSTRMRAHIQEKEEEEREREKKKTSTSYVYLDFAFSASRVKRHLQVYVCVSFTNGESYNDKPLQWSNFDIAERNPTGYTPRPRNDVTGMTFPQSRNGSTSFSGGRILFCSKAVHYSSDNRCNEGRPPPREGERPADACRGIKKVSGDVISGFLISIVAWIRTRCVCI
jgi:hypothetical protein